MSDITIIPERELRKDLHDSYYDIAICKIALEFGFVADIAGESVQDRLDCNQKIVEKILTELARRDKEEMR